MITDFGGRKIESEGNPGGDMATPQKYRKKPVTIEAIQLNIHNVREVAKWCGADLGYTFNIAGLGCTFDSAEPDWLDIHTLEGTMAAYVDDYIIRGVQGEFYPCKPDIFKETYEAV